MRYVMALLIAVVVVFVSAPAIGLAADEGAAGDTGTSDRATEGPTKVGIVDVKRVVDECEYKKLYEAKIEELLQRKRLEGVDLKQEVDKKIGDLQREQFLRAEEAKEEIQKEIEAQEQRLRDFAMEAKKAVEDENRKYSQELEDKVKRIVETAAEERGVNLVLNSMAVLYKSGVVDLTDLVLAKLNEEYHTEHGSANGGTNTEEGGAEAKEN